MTWAAIGLVLAVVSGAASLPVMLLLRPWRVWGLSCWLAKRWPWYRSWVLRLLLRRMQRAAQEATRVMGELLRPALEELARQFVALSGVLRGSEAE